MSRHNRDPREVWLTLIAIVIALLVYSFIMPALWP